jgi:hypothetical protein
MKTFTTWLEHRRKTTSDEDYIKHLLRTPYPNEHPNDPLDPDKYCPICGSFIGNEISHRCDPVILRILKNVQKKEKRPPGKIYQGVEMWNKRLEGPGIKPWLKP